MAGAGAALDFVATSCLRPPDSDLELLACYFALDFSDLAIDVLLQEPYRGALAGTSTAMSLSAAATQPPPIAP